METTTGPPPERPGFSRTTLGRALGSAGLYLFCLTLVFEPAFYVGLLLMLCALAVAPRGSHSSFALAGRVVRLTPMFFFAYMLLVAWTRTMQGGEAVSTKDAVAAVADLLAVSGALSLLTARSIQLHKKNYWLAPALYILAYLLQAFLQRNDVDGHRPLLGMGSGMALHTIAAATLMIAVLARACARTRQRGTRLALELGIFAVASGAIWLLILAQFRWAWLYLVLLIAIILWLLRGHFSMGSVAARRSRWLFRALVLVSLSMLIYQHETISGRLLEEPRAIISAIAADETIPPQTGGGIGHRLRLWRHAWPRFLASPVLGNGPGSVRQFVKAEPTLAFLGHYHNMYLVVLVETGLLGLMLLASWWFSLYRALFKAHKHGHVNGIAYAAAVSLGLAFFIYSFFQYRSSEGGQLFPILYFGYLVYLAGQSRRGHQGTITSERRGAN